MRVVVLVLCVFCLVSCGESVAPEPVFLIEVEDEPEVDMGGEDPLPEEPDILERLKELEGAYSVREVANTKDFRSFEIDFIQPLDHQEPDGVWFTQRIILHHRSTKSRWSW